MDELAQTRLVMLAVVVAVALAWYASVTLRRRREAHFAALATALGCEVTRENENCLHFVVELDGRTTEVRMALLGAGSGNPGGSGWYVVSELPLEGVSELHSADIRRRSLRRPVEQSDAAEFDEHFEIRDAGFPLRNGWLNAPMREVIVQFFAATGSLDHLAIERALLIHRSAGSVKRFDATGLRELLTRQVAVAKVLERTL